MTLSKEFNSAQRAAFCVYSGRGIAQLRNHLTEHFDSMNETNGTDDTEYDDDDYEIFNDDGTPEPDADVDMEPVAVVSDPASGYVTNTRGRIQPQAHEFVFDRHRSPRVTTIATSTIGAGRQGSNVPPSVNILGATSRLNAQIQDGFATPVAGPEGNRQDPHADQSMSNMRPIVESSFNLTGSQIGVPLCQYTVPSQHYAGMSQQGYQPKQTMDQHMQVHHYEQYAVPDVGTSSNYQGTPMDTGRWTMVDATSSNAEGSSNHWNVGRAWRSFHFRHNAQEDIYQSHPPASGGAYPRH